MTQWMCTAARASAWDGERLLGRGYAVDSDLHHGRGVPTFSNPQNMIDFGQGAIRCHPYVLQEMQATQERPIRIAAQAFDKLLF